MSIIKTRFKIILLSIVLLITGIVFIFGMYIWFLNKQDRVLTGTARPTFPYSDYSLEELNKLYPQYVNADTATTQTPEETHKKFIAALKRQDFREAARCCFRSGDWEAMEKMFESVKNNGQLDMMVGDLLEIKKESLGDTVATYSYLGTYQGKKVGNIMSFVKSSDGVWLIESL